MERYVQKMKQNTSKEKERKNVIIEAKGICCDLTDKNDFGFVSKLEMALIIRNLTIDFHEKKSFIASQKEAIDSYKEEIMLLKKHLKEGLK
jgi:hypothetical protein